MREIRYFCPLCQGMEIDLRQSNLVGIDQGPARCRLCSWTGSPDELIGALSEQNEKFWTSDRVASALLMAATKHAAGPMVQVLETIGLIPRIGGTPEEQVSATDVREGVMRAVLEGIVTGAFETAAVLSPAHFQKYDPPMAKLTASLFDLGEPYDRS